MENPTSRLDELFVSDETRREIESWLADVLIEGRQKITAATPTIDRTAMTNALDAIDLEGGVGLKAAVETVVQLMAAGLVQTTHPGYLGLFNPAPTFPAEVADRIAAAFNPQICVWSHAPAAVEIDTAVIRAMCSRLGFGDDGGGHFTSGGSEANATATVCALTAAAADFDNIGARAFPKGARIYASAESHLAWLKIAHQTGMGRRAVRLIATDGEGRMSPAALSQAIDEDVRNGVLPVMVAATAGTTNAGMIDPLRAIAAIAHEAGAWFHVDAAWGGAMIASARERSQLDGIQAADSVTIDAHKWFATTMGAGMYLTRRPELLTRAFRVQASYMPSNDPAVDLYVTSMQWSRRFVGLRLYLALATGGWNAFATHVERSIDLIERARTQLTELGWRVVNPSRMAIACVVPPVGRRSVEAIVSDVVSSGDYWVSVARFEQRPVLRFCVTHGQTSASDLDRFVARLEQLSLPV